MHKLIMHLHIFILNPNNVGCKVLFVGKFRPFSAFHPFLGRNNDQLRIENMHGICVLVPTTLKYLRIPLSYCL